MKNTLLSLVLFAATASGLRAAEPIPDSHRINGVAIGCQAYTFNRFSAFEAIEKKDQFDVMATVCGGGVAAQAEAVRHGISRALLLVDPANRPALKKAGLLTRDAREKERKKPGQPGARKKFQFSKR